MDQGTLDRVLSCLGLPGWFRHAFFECHALVRFRFVLASGLGQSWTRDGGIPQGCPLSMMFIVALQWSVKFDVRDLGGHLDTTFRRWSSTLAARVRLVISRLVLIFVLPLDFHGRVRDMYLPAALHGIEASFLASESLRKLRSSFCWVVWSRRQPLASIGAVLSLLVVILLFCVVWFRFRLLRGYLALWPAEVGRVYRVLELVGEGCPGHGPIHLLSASAAEIGFQWDSHALAWVRPGLPLLSNLAGPIQHFRAC